ncbi:MAG: CHASE2 domain-containing protein [Bacteroidetes bacterium]|nr:CHASE2 domain-containing protein [Bacteroidota bacterium]
MTTGKKVSLFLALANTVILFFLTSWFWSLPWLAGDEKLMIWATSAIRLMNRDMPESKEFALINVSYDQMLINKFDDFGFPVGNQVITDRQKLTRLMQIINYADKKPKYVFCDLYFEESTPYDSALNAEMRLQQNLIVSIHLDDNGNPRFPVLTDIKMGLSDYVIGNIFEGVYKFQLYFNDTLKLTPLIISEDLNNYQSKKKGPFVKIGDWFTLNYFIMNYRLLQKDIMYMEAGFNPVNLGELLLLPDADVSSFLENKIVIIGDFFEHDMHETLFEITSGPVVLINAYLTIINKDTVVNFFFIAIITILFFGLSYIAIYPEDMLENFIRRKYGNIKWVGNVTSFMSYLIILVVVSILTYFLFNIHLNVFFLSIYIFIIEKLSSFFFKRFGHNSMA